MARPWIAVVDDPGETLAAVQPRLSPDERRAVVVDVTEALRIARLYNATHLGSRPRTLGSSSATNRSSAERVRPPAR